MPVCLPIEGVKSIDSFFQVVSNEGDVRVIKDGRSIIRCLAEEIDSISEEEGHSKLSARMQIARKELEDGCYSPFDEVISSLK